MTTAVPVLAIDGGKTSCRLAVFDGPRLRVQAQGPGLPNIATAGADAAIQQILTDLLDRCGPDARRVRAVGIGLTGVFAPSPASRSVRDLIAEIVAADRIVVTSDVVTGYCGALGLEAGAVVAAGTGAIGLAVSPDGRSARTDGWGFLLDDAGSGFWIGRGGLRAALRAADGRGGSSALLRAATSRFGPPEALMAAIYGDGNPARAIAAFAPLVAEAAREGDPIARQLWDDAAAHLARNVVAAARRVFPDDAPVPVSWQGGLFAAGDLLRTPFLAEVAALLPTADPRPPVGTALEGARLLAAAEGSTVVDGSLDVWEMVR